MQKYLDNFCSDFALTRFKFINLVITAPPFGFCAKSLYTLDKHAAIMAPVPNTDFLFARQFVPKSPQKMLVLFFCRRGNDRENLIVSRIKRGCHAFDSPTLSGGIPAFEND